MIQRKYIHYCFSITNLHLTLCRQTQLRHGGDLQGLIDSLDYIHGMGIEAIYIAGTPFINKAWGADGYSPLDFSLLDQHFGDIQAWRDAIIAIHDRGMYGKFGQSNFKSPLTCR